MIEMTIMFVGILITSFIGIVCLLKYSNARREVDYWRYMYDNERVLLNSKNAECERLEKRLTKLYNRTFKIEDIEVTTMNSKKREFVSSYHINGVCVSKKEFVKRLKK